MLPHSHRKQQQQQQPMRVLSAGKDELCERRVVAAFDFKDSVRLYACAIKENIFKSGKIKRYLFSVHRTSNHQFIGGSIKISDGSNAPKQNNINKQKLIPTLPAMRCLER